ncbi:MAG TPA: type IV toxin-antitoxin system AbiEi family antitoxin domain-containing protein [Pirellulaceae bacterium]|nr:type IV toxin-antitoxin system AbiEi family antitoxin domain-containing protein [Pirellulaceae bacterium]
MDIGKSKQTVASHAIAAFKRHGGLLRMSDAIRAGVHRDTLRAMVERGDLERISRGLYRLSDAPSLTHPDLATVAVKVPEGVICLLSALAFHELTTQIPHEVYLAINRNSEPPRIDFPPVRTFRFSGEAFTEGIEMHNDDSVTLRVYSREKTIADCFKFRNKVGLDACVEALRRYRETRGFNADALLHYAGICRVKQVLRPYIEAIL